MIALLTLRTRRSTRACAAGFLALYAAFASGTAYGALDLLHVPAPAPSCSTPSPAGASCCGCGMTHSPEAACCCGSAKSDATAEFSFTQAARCSNPDSGAPGDLARMSPHASPETPVPQAAPETGQAPDSIASPDSIHASPEDKVPIAR